MSYHIIPHDTIPYHTTPYHIIHLTLTSTFPLFSASSFPVFLPLSSFLPTHSLRSWSCSSALDRGGLKAVAASDDSSIKIIDLQTFSVINSIQGKIYDFLPLQLHTIIIIPFTSSLSSLVVRQGIYLLCSTNKQTIMKKSITDTLK